MPWFNSLRVQNCRIEEVTKHVMLYLNEKGWQPKRKTAYVKTEENNSLLSTLQVC